MTMWCGWHLRCCDYPNGWACGAHLAEAHVFQCPFTQDDIDPEIGLPINRKHTPPGDGVCRDYRPKEETPCN